VGLVLLLQPLGCSSDGAGPGDANGQSHNEHSSGCLDTRTAVAPEQETALGFAASHVLGFVEGRHVAVLTWPDSSTTTVTFTVESAEAYFVESVSDPGFQLDIYIECSNHLQIDTAATFVTADGRIDHHWSDLVFRADDASLVLAATNLELDSLGGNYAPEVSDNQCPLMLQFNMTLEPAGFSGSLLDTVAASPCDSVGNETGVSPRQAGAWEPTE
jgi:hypothetical protein